MANLAELRKMYEEEQALRLKLDALVCEAHQVLAAAQQHHQCGQEGAASILLDAAHRILATYVES